MGRSDLPFRKNNTYSVPMPTITLDKGLERGRL